MTVTAADLCNLAAALKDAPDEASHRAAISRAYYSAYHASRAWHAAKLPLPGSLGIKGGMHEQFIHQLTNPDASCTAGQMLRSKALLRQS